MGNAHRLIVGEVDRQTVRNLFRTPRARLPSVRSPRLVAAFPRCEQAHDVAVLVAKNTRQLLLHALSKLLVLNQFRYLRSPRREIGLPLRHRRTVLELATRVAAFRRISREMVDGEPPIRSAMLRILKPPADMTEISSRSEKDK